MGILIVTVTAFIFHMTVGPRWTRFKLFTRKSQKRADSHPKAATRLVFVRNMLLNRGAAAAKISSIQNNLKHVICTSLNVQFRASKIQKKYNS